MMTGSARPSLSSASEGSQFHATTQVGGRETVQRQSLDQRRIGKQKITDCPFAKDIMAERNAVIAEVTQAFACDERVYRRGRHSGDAKVIGLRKNLLRHCLQHPRTVAVAGRHPSRRPPIATIPPPSRLRCATQVPRMADLRAGTGETGFVRPPAPDDCPTRAQLIEALHSGVHPFRCRSAPR